MPNVTLIAGAGGLGTAIAKQVLLQEKTTVPIVCSRKAEQTPNSPGIVKVDTDLLTSSGREKMFLETTKLGTLNRCVISIGSALSKSLADSTDQEIESCIRINFTVPLLILKSLIKLQQERKIGVHCIIISSTTALRVRHGVEASYGGAKAGIAQAIANVFEEWIGIHQEAKITHFLPGGMATPFWSNTTQDTTSFMNPDQVAQKLWQRTIEFERSEAKFDEWVLNRGLIPQEGRILFPNLQFKPGITPFS